MLAASPPRPLSETAPPAVAGGLRRWRILLGLAALLAAIAAAYTPSLSGEFMFDDEHAIVDNFLVKDLGVFLKGFFLESFGQRGVTELTFALDHRLAGLDVRAYHATSVLLHLVTVLIVFAFTRRTLARSGLGRRDGLAFLVAAAWGLHPIQTEAVSYVVQRAEVLASLFYLLTLLGLLEAEERGPGWRGIAGYAVALAAFALGVGSKPIIVTAPVVWLGYLFCLPGARPARGRDWARRLALAVPLLAASALATASNLSAVRGSGGAGFDLPGLGAGRYLLTELRAHVAYLGLLLVPARQNLDWEFPVAQSLREPRTLGAAAVVAALMVAAGLLLRWAGRRPHGAEGAAAARVGALGIAWFFALLAPTSTFVPLADPFVEHRLYLASWGAVLALCTAGAVLSRSPGLRRLPRWAPAALAAAVVLALGASTHARNRVWTSKLSLWQDVTAKSPTKARAHANLAHALAALGDHARAVDEYRQALLWAADGTVPWIGVLRNLAASLMLLGHLDEARDVMRNALALDPRNPDLLNNLAITLLVQGDLDGAEARAREALRTDAHHGGAHNTLGEVLMRRRDLRGALHEFSTASALDPDVPMRVYNLAVAQERLGMTAEACATWSRLQPIERDAARVAEARLRMRQLGCAMP